MKTLPMSTFYDMQYEQIVLENGLTVLVQNMENFNTVHAIYGTKFGSIDRDFMYGYKKMNVPAGIAHFLEHKMFENEDGDAFSLYAKTGASANAYTSFDKTCYIFTASDHIDENLDILLSFVSTPYFTDESVLKEQGIIGQEIKMYDDSAEWRLMMGALSCLYGHHSVKDDIAGTVESISEITPELLYTCTDAFYRPENMVLAVAGNIDMQTVLNACERANIKAKSTPVVMMPKAEDEFVHKSELTFKMAVAKPHLCIAFKEKPFDLSSKSIIKDEVTCDILTELIVGSMTPLYRKLYDEGLVAPGFSGEFLNINGATCILFSGETNKPQEVKKLLLDEIENLRKNGVNEQMFNLCKNLMYGEFVQGLENVDDVANGLAWVFFKNRTPEQMMQTLAQLKLKDVNNMLSKVLFENKSATIIINPINAE